MRGRNWSSRIGNIHEERSWGHRRSYDQFTALNFLQHVGRVRQHLDQTASRELLKIIPFLVIRGSCREKLGNGRVQVFHPGIKPGPGGQLFYAALQAGLQRLGALAFR